jgi:hypothetical protein
MKRLIGFVTLLALALLVAPALAQDGASGGRGGLIIGLWHLHAFLRWVAVIVAAAVIIKLGLGVARGGPFDALSARLMMAFGMVLRLQWVLGIIFALVLYIIPIGLGNTPTHVWLHLTVMTVVVGLSEMYRRWKNAPDSVQYRNSLFLVIACLVLIGVGVALLPQGWRLFPVT